MKRLERLRLTTRNKIEASKNAFRDARRIARAHGFAHPSIPGEDPDQVEKDFDELFGRIQAAQGMADLEALKERAKELENLRSYVLPVNELRLEARARINELRSWDVPEGEVRSIENAFLPVVDKPLEGVPTADRDRVLSSESSAAFLRVLEEFDYWDTYIDWFTDLSSKIMLGLFSCVLLFIALAMAMFSFAAPAGAHPDPSAFSFRRSSRNRLSETEQSCRQARWRASSSMRTGALPKSGR